MGIKDFFGKIPEYFIIGYKYESPKQRADKALRISAHYAKQNRQSRFSAEKVNATEMRYTSLDIAVTVKTDRPTGEVSFVWEFLTSSSPRYVTLNYTSSLQVLQKTTKHPDEQMTEAEGATVLMGLAALVLTVREEKEKGNFKEFAQGVLSADQSPSPNLQLVPFAPKSTLRKDYASKVLPEGTWYVRFEYVAGGSDDSFDYTVGLEKAVRKVAPERVDQSIEQHVESLTTELPRKLEIFAKAAKSVSALKSAINESKDLSSQEKRIFNGMSESELQAIFRKLVK